MVRLVKLALGSQFSRMHLNFFNQGIVILASVFIWLSNPKHIQIGPIYNQKFHFFSSGVKMFVPNRTVIRSAIAIAVTASITTLAR